MISRLFAVFYVFLIFLVCSLAFSTHNIIPENAMILIDKKNKVYYSPMYFKTYNLVEPSDLSVGRLIDIKDTDIKPDEECWNLGCFVEFPVSYLQDSLEKMGFITPRVRRWSEEGNWNY